MAETDTNFFSPEAAKTNDAKEVALSLVTSNQLEAITRGEIDVQITTAHKFPRSMTRFKDTAVFMATIDQETAESCIYVRPVGKKDGVMQYAEGLSVRMAEIVGACYGNLRVGSMIIEQTDRYVITRGYAHDLESNFASTSESKESTVTKSGQPMSEPMRAVIAKASLAKARRDATFQVVPKALCRPIERAARELIAGDAQSVQARIDRVVTYIQRLNIDEDRVWAALAIAGSADLTSEKLMIFTGIRNSIRDGDTTIDEAFPMLAKKPDVKGAPKKDPTPAPVEEPKHDAGAAAVLPTATATPKAAEPEQPATPIADDGLLPELGRLMEVNGIKGEELTAWLIKTGQLQTGQSTGNLTLPNLRKLVERFAPAVAQIVGGRSK